jgi:hypothetical protein
MPHLAAVSQPDTALASPRLLLWLVAVGFFV